MTEHSVCSRLEKVRTAMADKDLAAWIVRTSDPYLSEYVPEHWTGVRWLSGFTGSTAVLAVTSDEAALFTDSRYWEQADRELKGSGISLVRLGAAGEPEPAAWISARLGRGERIGTDYAAMSISRQRLLEKVLTGAGLILEHDDGLLDAVWQENRPPVPASPVYRLASAGRSTADKLSEVRKRLKASGADALFVAPLDDTAWLTNCRGTDIHCNPVFLSYMLVTGERALLFCRAERMKTGVAEALLGEGVEIAPPEQCLPMLTETARSARLLIDPDRTPARILPMLAVKPVEAISPVTLMKSRKSRTELENIRSAMVSDGIALCEFYAELEERLADGERMTEIRAAELLHAHRAAQPDFLDESFDTIAAFGPNAALPHYTPSPATDRPLSDGLLLIDSGGQYRTGTTDITRMTAVGSLSDEMKKDVTLVLKGMVALARACVPAGTSGAQLDSLARAPLWREGLDFGHGTGHGVGFVLSVHEGPFSVSPRSQKTGELGLQAGLVISDEPGVYRPGKWGVRIENLISARPAASTEFGSFLDFEVLTLCPIDVRALIPSILTSEERDWLNSYHARIRKILSPHLSLRAEKWLEQAVLPI